MMLRVQRYPVLANPLAELFGFEREVDNLFGEFLGSGLYSSTRQTPALDVAEYEGETVVVAEVPGVKKDDLKISVQDDVLQINGTRKANAIPENGTWLRNEVGTGEFSRTIQLPHAVSMDGIAAELTDGVLRITLPKAAEARPREIRVK